MILATMQLSLPEDCHWRASIVRPIRLKPTLRLVHQGTGQKRRRKSRAAESASKSARKRKQQVDVEPEAMDEDEINLQRVSLVVPVKTSEGSALGSN